MINVATILYGLTMGGILYLTSIGLSLTYGMMRVINFSHALFYSMGAYAIYSISGLSGNFFLGIVFATLIVIPVVYVVEKFVIKRLYGKSSDYTIIATYAILMIGIEIIRLIYGYVPVTLSPPTRTFVDILGAKIPVYRISIILVGVIVFLCLELFFKKTLVGKIVLAGLHDMEAVKSLGINVDKYFTVVFIMGGCLAALGGAMYAPIIPIEPYMGLTMLQLCFAIVIIGGRGNIRSTFYTAIIIGQLMAITGRIWGVASDVIVYVIMAIVLTVRGPKGD